jgi:hypothetical protein
MKRPGIIALTIVLTMGLTTTSWAAGASGAGGAAGGGAAPGVGTGGSSSGATGVPGGNGSGGTGMGDEMNTNGNIVSPSNPSYSAPSINTPNNNGGANAPNSINGH